MGSPHLDSMQLLRPNLKAWELKINRISSRRRLVQNYCLYRPARKMTSPKQKWVLRTMNYLFLASCVEWIASAPGPHIYDFYVNGRIGRDMVHVRSRRRSCGFSGSTLSIGIRRQSS